MTENMIRPKMGRKPISTTGEPRNLRWPLTVAVSEGARLDALPGGSNPEKVFGALDRLDAVTEALRDLVDACTSPQYTGKEFGAAVDHARAVLGEAER